MNVLPSSQLTPTSTSTPPSSQKRPSQHLTKLHLLREHDTERVWSSLADKRTCLLCGSDFTGEEIRIRVRNGRPVFECPDEPCRGSLHHFVYAGNPLLSESAWSDWMRVPTRHDAGL